MAKIIHHSVLLLLAASVCLVGEPRAITLPDLEIGSNLQTWTTLTLAEAAPETGLEITLSSEDPAKLRFARMPDQPGQESLLLKIRPGFKESPEFWVQALSGSGSVQYIAAAATLGKASGTVRLHPSGIIVVGPYKAPSFSTTPRSVPSKLSLQSVRLDASGKVAEPQYVAGGRTVALEVRTSDTTIGTVNPAAVEIAGGAAAAVTDFLPVRPGTTAVDISVPAGFTKPAEHATVTAVVNMPGIALPDEGLLLGQNLQVRGLVGLGEPAPETGLTVRIRSEDAKRMLVSPSADEVGSEEIEVQIAPGGVSAPFYLQGLGRDGTVTCTASAPGFRTRTTEIHLAPSGVVLMYRPYGPPDEAEVLRETHEGVSPTTALHMSLAKTKKVPLNVWTVRLDPVTLRSADITVQPLRAGYTLDVEVHTSNPGVGTVASPIRIAAGTEAGLTDFTPTAAGESILTVATPPGFTKSTNSTTVKTIIYP